MNLWKWVGASLLPVGIAPPTARQRKFYQQAAWIGMIVLSLLLGCLKPAQGQASNPNPPQPAKAVVPNSDKVVSTPGRNDATGQVPPLPFTVPQIGPLIKQVAPNDINRRTTAFIPQSLDNLTPIQFPKTPGKWIRVDLSEQIVVAYEGQKPIRAFHISSGLPGTPTVTGEFHIRMKVLSQTMTGGVGNMYYNLPNVKWVQYFYQDYSFHGTYWHNNFGHPMSHGCINMTNADAKWLFDWAAPTWDGKTAWYKTPADTTGTLVIIHE